MKNASFSSQNILIIVVHLLNWYTWQIFSVFYLSLFYFAGSDCDALQTWVWVSLCRSLAHQMYHQESMWAWHFLQTRSTWLLREADQTGQCCTGLGRNPKSWPPPRRPTHKTHRVMFIRLDWVFLFHAGIILMTCTIALERLWRQTLNKKVFDLTMDRSFIGLGHTCSMSARNGRLKLHTCNSSFSLVEWIQVQHMNVE